MLLDTLIADLHACRICRDAPRFGPPLPHEPRPIIQATATVKILIAGQAPGTRVHASGKPFTDPSGDRLRQWMGVDETQFYDARRIAIVPMGHCFPGLDAKGGDLPPRRECAPQWRARVMESLPAVELILVIGQYARDWHLPDQRKQSLTETVQDWRAISRNNNPRVIPLPHPSWRNSGWLKKHPWFETDLLPELRHCIQQLL
ncbi:MAG: uracil-DNA glycosylase family protein [Beijerinckiaceae bacterium]